MSYEIGFRIETASEQNKAIFLQSLRFPHVVRTLIEGYDRYVKGVITGGSEQFDTHFVKAYSSSWIHGWDLILAAGEAVSRTSNEHGIVSVPRFNFSRPVRGNAVVRVFEGVVEKPVDALAFGQILTGSRRTFSVAFKDDGKPFEPIKEGVLPASPIAATMSSTSNPSKIQVMDRIPPAFFEEMDFDHPGAYLSSVFSMLTAAGAKLINQSADTEVIIARVDGFQLPSFSVYSNPRTQIHSELVGDPWYSKSGIEMRSVRSAFKDPRGGENGTCLTTYAIPKTDQLPD